MMTTQPDRDRAVLASAERQAKEISARYGWPTPEKIEIRVYPDVETFRNGTGEPGWVAARTTGRRIDIQPAAPREATIRHELLHVFVESQANAALPVWFREGLVGYLARPVHAAVTDFDDPDMRQTENVGRARRAYSAATAKVAELVERYGAATVLGWVKTGLPREVANASVKAAATNRK